MPRSAKAMVVRVKVPTLAQTKFLRPDVVEPLVMIAELKEPTVDRTIMPDRSNMASRRLVGRLTRTTRSTVPPRKFRRCRLRRTVFLLSISSIAITTVDIARSRTAVSVIFVMSTRNMTMNSRPSIIPTIFVIVR